MGDYARPQDEDCLTLTIRHLRGLVGCADADGWRRGADGGAFSANPTCGRLAGAVAVFLPDHRALTWGPFNQAQRRGRSQGARQGETRACKEFPHFSFGPDTAAGSANHQQQHVERRPILRSQVRFSDQHTAIRMHGLTNISEKRSGLGIVVVHKNAFEDIHIASSRNAGEEIPCNDLTSPLCHLGFENGAGAFRHTGELKQDTVERRVGAQEGRQ